MTLTDCQLLSIVAQLGTFAAAAERLHITPSAVSHAVSGVEAECGFPLFTRTKSGVTLTAAAENSCPPSSRCSPAASRLTSRLPRSTDAQGRTAAGGVQLGLRDLAAQDRAGLPRSVPGIDVQIYQGRMTTSRAG